MKKSIKEMLPFWLVKLLKVKSKKKSRFKNMSAKEVFSKIYCDNHWGSTESISGIGSEHGQTRNLIEGLRKLLIDKGIKSLLDIPCGDFNWMQDVDLSGIQYVGADIVEKLIHANKNKYRETSNFRFIVLDLIHDPLPKMELIIVRDCLVHLSFKDISDVIANIKSSGCKYLLATSFMDYHTNYDIVTGDWRRLNMQKKPFCFPAPISVINENCTQDYGKFKDKSMALWEVSEIPLMQ